MKKFLIKLQDFFRNLDNPIKILSYIIITTLTAAFAGLLISNRIIIALLLAIPPYLLMINLIKNSGKKTAVVNMLLWAAILGTVMTLVCLAMPDKTEQLIIRGSDYRDEMFSWVKTGIGKEGTPSQFIPEHLLHLGIFIVLSLATVSAASILFGTILMNYMAFYVAQLMLYTDHKFPVFVIGWHFWSLFRIAGFVILGVVLCEPLLSRIYKYEWKLKEARFYFAAAFSLIILDIVCKTLFAPSVGTLVKRLVNI